MIEKLKQPLVLFGLAILLLAIVAFWNGRGSDLNTTVKSPGNTGVINDTSNGDVSRAVTKDVDNTATDKMPRHQDMLSEEMKQAIRDKLLFHGPMEVIEHPDGRIELPSNGRFTQMPVAVEMPDGTIQIKEYSSLPD